MKVLFLVLPMLLLISCGNKSKNNSSRPSTKVITVTSVEKEESKKILNKIGSEITNFNDGNSQIKEANSVYIKTLSQAVAENCSVTSYSIVDNNYLSHLTINCSSTDELGITSVEFDINYIKNEKVFLKFKFDRGEMLLKSWANYMNEKTKNEGLPTVINGINIQNFINNINQNSSIEIGNKIKNLVTLFKEQEVDINLEEKHPGDYTLKLSHKDNPMDINAILHIILKDNPSSIKFNALISLIYLLGEDAKDDANKFFHGFYLVIKNK